MVPILRFIAFPGSKKKELRFACLITCGCLLRVLCLVRRPVTTLDCALWMDSNWASSRASAQNQFLRLQLIRAKWHYVQVFYTEVYQHWTSKVESTDGNFFMSVSKVQFSHCQFSQSSQPVNRFYWPYPALDFIQFG